MSAIRRSSAAIAQERDLQGFAKLTGSQRQVGLIFPGDALRQVFLGTLVLGDERAARQYGQDETRDVAGFVERIGPNRWRLVMPRPHSNPSSTWSSWSPRERIDEDPAMARGRRHDRYAARPPPPRPCRDSIRADMPQLMTLYRDLHANPELSMQEVRTPALLAPRCASSASRSPSMSARPASSR